MDHSGNREPGRDATGQWTECHCHSREVQMNRLTKDQRTMYSEFCERFTTCWACDVERLPEIFYRSANWRWLTQKLENHHIIGGAGRLADRRCIVRLSRIHHATYHGDCYRPTRKTPLVRVLTLENMVFLKQTFDPENLDLKFLQNLQTKHNLPIIPEPITDRHE